MNSLLVIGIGAIPVVSMFAVIGALAAWRFCERRKGLRSPFTDKLLRAPGQSLVEQLDSDLWDFAGYLVLAVVFPLLLAVFYFAQVLGTSHNTSLAIWYTMMAVLATLAIQWHAVQKVKTVR